MLFRSKFSSKSSMVNCKTLKNSSGRYQKNSYKKNDRKQYYNWNRKNKTILQEIGLSGAVCLGLGVFYWVNFSDEFEAQEKKYFIGVDGGGTKTMVVLIDEEGEVRSRVVVGSTNWNSVGEEKANAALKEGIDTVIAETGITRDNVLGIWLSMSGVDRPHDITKVKTWIKGHLPNSDINVSNDAYGALASGTKGKLDHNVVVISGTGSICVGFNKDHQAVRSGGWGPMVNDNASGYYLGSRLLFAISEHADGGEQTQMYDLFMKSHNLSLPGDIITWAYTDKKWSDVASLGRLVYQAALNGDPVAVKIINDTADNISSLISLTISKMDHCENIVLSGGNLTFEDSLLYNTLKPKLESKHPNTNILLPTTDPAEASALLARNQLD